MSYHRRPSNDEHDAAAVLACLAHLTRSNIEPDPIDPYDLEGDTTP